MCTVSIFPKGNNDFILTSNRDEAPSRISLPPSFYDFNGKKLLYPKDELSEGTWVGVSENNRLICLLNGGFKLHTRQPVYRKSRGIVVKELLVAPHIINIFNDYNFLGIEPFTLVIVDWNDGLQFYQFVWDGLEKYFEKLPLEPKIWSSATLYTSDMKVERLEWFKAFVDTNENSANDILDFHKYAGKDNDEYGTVMNRGFVKTTSITQVCKTGTTVEMRYENVRNKFVSKEQFKFPEPINE
ncbi:NRDE family protein [Tamlana sp. 62-3]|uniref:NRDE family protein n=1 Tax=Neotamlana sargassicola TaxID=2883125 RepID=A0A9X1I837_9FLAO|nr:NRDE family protein [Tamlana sargassicola]MCB4809552.1 NRDE family protein [Tamlana sargassicola]